MDTTIEAIWKEIKVDIYKENIICLEAARMKDKMRKKAKNNKFFFFFLTLLKFFVVVGSG